MTVKELRIELQRAALDLELIEDKKIPCGLPAGTHIPDTVANKLENLVRDLRAIRKRQ